MEDKNFYSVKGAAFEAIDIPKVKEIRGKKYMYYGEDNLFPELLIELYDGSAMHHTAIEAIKDGIIGDGLEIIGDNAVNKKGETVDEVFERISLDYTIYNGYALNVVWNKGGDRIAEIYHLPFANVRSGKRDEDDEVVEYYYSSDWTNLRKHKEVAYRAFDPTDNKGENASQIYYCYGYTPGNDVYPMPAYVGGLNDIALDGRVSRFHNANISNGLAPSMFVKFNNGIPSPEERRDIYREIEDTFTGEDNAGRFFLSFSDGPERAMEVQPIENANDDYYLTLEQRITSRILTAHRITSPLLLGIKDASGFSNNADEIKVAYAHFEGTVVEPKRKKIVSTFGYILALHGLNVSLQVKPNKLIPETGLEDNATETNIIE